MRKYDLTINNNSYEVLVKKVTETEALVEVNGQELTVSINQIESLILPETVPQVVPVKKAGQKPPSGAAQIPAASADAIIAPMPGQIKAILVREGDEVKAGQKLLIMEAMKLENKLPAPRDGRVKHILVRDGDIVSQGQELLTIK